MAWVKYTLAKLVRWFFLLLLAASVLDTTNVLFISPLYKLALSVSRDEGLITLKRLLPKNAHAPSSPPHLLTTIDTPRRSKQHSVQPVFAWTSSQFTLENGLGHAEPIPLDTSVFVSKVLASSTRPSNVHPYFYRATGPLQQTIVTITTLITSNRFRVFSRLVEKYQGPISVTVHVQEGEDVEAVLRALDSMYSASISMTTFVDVHLVVDAFDRQFNTWRNVARFFARTDFVMILDIDFYPTTDFRDIVSTLPEPIFQKLSEGLAALVVPAFEYKDYLEGTDYRSFPSEKKELLSLVNQDRLGMFHASWAPGHSSTDYRHFYATSPGDVYRVTKYQPAYEPYVIIKKEGPPWCDERFVGYGGNKAACLFEMYLAGVSYYVLGDHFIIHQNHLYEEAVRQNERKYNRKVYSDFKDETCLRYLKSYHDSGMLNSSIALNAVTECKKIRSAARLAAEYL